MDDVMEHEKENEARKRLEASAGQVWSTAELQRDFDVESFCAPFVLVTRKSDKVRGALEFIHTPRLYFGFEPR